MKRLIGKSLGNVVFTEQNGNLYGNLTNYGVNASYLIKPVGFFGPAKAILMDLDGTTLTSEEFWIFVIEQTMQKLLGADEFSLEEADIPFVSGFTTVDHLNYCLNKYSPDKDINSAVECYHNIAEFQLKEIMQGRGRIDAFKPAEGLKEFLTEVKRRKIKIGLATSGLDYKAIPEIVAAFRALNMGDPRNYYDAIITGGRRKDVGDYGTLGEVASKPHPWIYTELAYLGLKVTDPTTVIGIEDSAAGVLSLRFSGFPVVGLNGGNITQSGLDCLCCKKVNKLEEILQMV